MGISTNKFEFIGGGMCFKLAMFTFVAGITKHENRAFRNGIIHICTGIAFPVAMPVGAWLLREGKYK